MSERQSLLVHSPRLALLRGSVARFLSAVAPARTTASCPLLRSSAITLRPLHARIMLREYTAHCPGKPRIREREERDREREREREGGVGSGVECVSESAASQNM